MAKKKKVISLKELMQQYDDRHLHNILRSRRLIDSLYTSVAEEAARIGIACPFDSTDKPFFFADYPATNKAVNKLIHDYAQQMEYIVGNGNADAFMLSFAKNTALLEYVKRKTGMPDDMFDKMNARNLEAIKAFTDRKVNGMNLSARVWNMAEQTKSELEMALSVGIGQAKSAAELSRDVRGCLLQPHKLFRRVRDKDGVLRLSKNAQAYHSGRGVYRSSYKNALRLTATENNIAYRTADHDKWQQFDFVIGIDIHLSNNHTLNGMPFHDICDELKGRYPKEFKFTGWHPFCRCIATTILADWDEQKKIMQAQINGEDISGYEYKGTIKETPQNFNEWVQDNAERINASSSTPYFIKDNFVDGDISKGASWI